MYKNTGCTLDIISRNLQYIAFAMGKYKIGLKTMFWLN
jgi:hypothetical protein